MIPILRLLDLNLEPIILLDDYESLYFEEKYDDVGTCTLTMSASSDNFKYINKNMILYLDTYHCWYIEEINIDNDIATITALNLSFIFSHRVTVPLKGDTHLKTKAISGKVIKYLIDKTTINSTESGRNIPFKFTNSCNIGHTINFESRYKNLLNEIQSICHYSALGFKVGIDINTNSFLIDIYNGRDLHQETIFSEVFDNIEDIKIVDSNIDYKNIIYVAGKGEGLDRLFIKVGDTKNSGWLRREDIKDARDKEHEEDLIVEAETILEEKCIKTSLEIVVVGDDDVEVGDIVTVMTAKYNYQFTQRIIEKNIEYTSTNGKVVGVVIGNPKPALSFNKDDSNIID